MLNESLRLCPPAAGVGRVALRDIARAAGVSFAALYARAPGKAALLDRLSKRFDHAALSAAEDDVPPDAEIHDRLFEAVMARLRRGR